MYLVYPQTLEERPTGSKLVGCMRHCRRPEILLSPREVLTILKEERLGERYIQNLAASAGSAYLFDCYQPIGVGLSLTQDRLGLKQWSY